MLQSSGLGVARCRGLIFCGAWQRVGHRFACSRLRGPADPHRQAPTVWAVCAGRAGDRGFWAQEPRGQVFSAWGFGA
jgi:hypothetical protein